MTEGILASSSEEKKHEVYEKVVSGLPELQ